MLISTDANHPDGAKGGRSDLRWALLCAVVAVAATLVTLPFVESGINDDWSYARTALDLARTGRFIYNGWATAMVGAQAFWGALFITLFGFSFTVVRLSTLFFSVGSVALTYALGRRWDLSSAHAVFAAIALATSPLFVPLSASFMTDVPALFFWLLALYAATRAAQSSNRAPLIWLAVLAASGVLGATIRQIVGLAPLVLLPTLGVLWHLPGENRPVIGRGQLWAYIAALWGVSAALILWSVLWFIRQPYSIQDNISLSEMTLANIARLPLHAAQGALTLSLLALPCTVWLLALPASQRLRFWSGATGGALLLLGAVALLDRQKIYLYWPLKTFWPYWGNVVYSIGQYRGTFVGAWTWALPPILRLIVLIGSLLAGGALVSLAAGAIIRRFRRRNSDLQTINVPPGLIPGVLVTVCYFLVMLCRSFSGPQVLFDRYLLPILPVVCILVLRYLTLQLPSERTRRQEIIAGGAAWALLVVWAWYGIAATHDYFAASRARLQAVETLTQRGLPRLAIAAGIEPDSWVEIEMSGYLNDPRIRVPAGAYREPEPNPGAKAIYGWFPQVPSLRIQTAVGIIPGVNARNAEGVDLVVPFTAWLPPVERAVVAIPVRQENPPSPP